MDIFEKINFLSNIYFIYFLKTGGSSLAEVKTFLSKAEKIHQKAIVFDGHCDTILEVMNNQRTLGKKWTSGHLDVPRMKEGGIDVQFFAIFIESVYKPDRSVKRALQLIDCFYREVDKNQNDISLVTNYHQIKEVNKAGKIAAILSIEGGEALEGDLGVLRAFHRLGVRLLTLTWNQRNQIADGISESRTGGGLTEFGLNVIDEMNKLKMLIDVSHLSENGFWDVIKNSKMPIVASHSNCYALCPHLRNLKDEQIKVLAENGGVIGITFVPNFLTQEKRRTTLQDVVKHINYLVEKVGIDYVGLGSDFDGTGDLPLGLEGADKIPNLTEELLNQGYKGREIKKILGGNFLRVFKEVVG
ncbi:MAG TPA: membrane dipeptidase [Candidatus Atribacteria bacterium]|nr:membrane dipeptidase [Candidatus Atribacteria bacterium]